MNSMVRDKGPKAFLLGLGVNVGEGCSTVRMEEWEKALTGFLPTP